MKTGMRFLHALATALLSATAAMAAPPLLLPHAGASPKNEAPRPFKSQGHRVRFNLHEVKGLRHGDELELRLPDGKVHPLVFDLLKDEGNGVTTWIGYHKGSANKLRAIVTHGPGGSFGRISTPDGDYRLVPGEGFDWLVDMVQEQEHLPIVDLGNDARVPAMPKALLQQPLYAPEYQPTLAGQNTVAVSKATPAQVVVDLMVVHTNGYASNLGSNLQTRLNFMVASANTMFADSEVGIVLRLVHSVAVSYPDSGGGDDALDAITPVSGGGTGVFSGIEALRTQYGADMVTFLRSGSDFGGSGIAWVATGPIGPSWAPYMYSVVTGCVRGCEWVWVHELGHNMGNMHDRATSSWQAGGVSNPQAGSYSYSFGYYSCNANVLNCNPTAPGGCSSQPECGSPRNTTNNFSDIMAYFHATTTRNLKFSNPNLTCAGAAGIQVACGVAEGASNSADAARSMNNNRTALSALRATTVGTTPQPLPATTTTLAPTPASSSVGGAVTLTATVSSGSGTPGGTVHFRDNGASIAGCTAVALSAGRAVCNTSFAAGGTHPITAQYSGSASFEGSTSANLGYSVATLTATVAIGSSANPVSFGSPLSITATVSGASGAPTGTVAFRDNGSTIGGCSAVGLVASSGTSATATCTTSGLAAGAHDLTARYSGSGTYGTLDSTALSQQVSGGSIPATSLARLGNISTRGFVGTAENVMIGGFIISGSSSKTVVVLARGPSLVPYGIANALPNPSLQVVRSSDQSLVASNDNWGSAPNAAAIATSGFAPGHALESAVMATLPPGAYTAIVSGVGGSSGVGLVEVYEVDAPDAPLTNLSTRGRVGAGGDVMIGGFVIQGDTSQTVVITAKGPSLRQYGITTAISNPTMQLIRQSDSALIATNDDWGAASNAAAIQATGLAPTDARESGILVTLPPGAYTVLVSGVAGGTGVGIIEINRP